MTSQDPDSLAWFAADAAAADAKFHGLAADADSHRHPSPGPAGEPLFCRVARIGPVHARKVMFLQSGTHGTELCAGSGIQVGLLAQRADLPLPADTALVLIHNINPWGAAWDRYVNEDNVDLMKNFTYGEHPAPSNPLFAEIDAMLAIPTLGTPEGLAAMAERRAALQARHGEDRILAALKAGQADFPTSIVYYGRTATWSKRLLDAIVLRHAAGAAHVLFVDLHTGVGPRAGAYVVAEGAPASRARIHDWTEGEAHATDLLLSRPLYGFITDLVPGCELTVSYIEGGTEPWGWEMRQVMLQEMFHHFHADRNSAEARAVRARFKAFYYPGTPDWIRPYWASTSATLSRFIAGFAAI